MPVQSEVLYDEPVRFSAVHDRQAATNALVGLALRPGFRRLPIAWVKVIVEQFEIAFSRWVIDRNAQLALIACPERIAVQKKNQKE